MLILIYKEMENNEARLIKKTVLNITGNLFDDLEDTSESCHCSRITIHVSMVLLLSSIKDFINLPKLISPKIKSHIFNL